MGDKVLPRWNKLDNAAKIFPSNSTVQDSKVFRFVCELKENVKPDILQSALDKTINQFPFFQSVIKRGVFWYYFEESNIKPVVQLESEPPCMPLYDTDGKNLLFKVFYYGKRVSVEVYHALSDGTGALQFLRTLIYYYLLECYDELKGLAPSLEYDASQFQKEDDSFQKYCEKPLGTGVKDKLKAYHISKERTKNNNLAVIEGRMSLKTLLEHSRAMGVTITEFLTAVFIRAIHQEMSLRDKDKSVVITVPVNLRGYFPSESARNFFTIVNVSYNFNGTKDSLEAVANHIRQTLREELKEDKLREQMNVWCNLEHNIFIRLLPLTIKDIILRAASFIVRKNSTASFSNVGKVSMPSCMEKYINLFTAFTSPNILQVCACSFNDNYIVSFAGPFRNHDIERAFFCTLTDAGIDVEIAANGIE